jgi:hypothetical protein
MPDTTVPRGYPYPVYGDAPMDFPDAIQDLATAIDADMTLNENRILAAYNRPSVRMTAGANQTLINNVAATAVFTAGALPFNNAGMGDLANNRLVLSEQGVYWVTGRVTLTALGSGAAFGLRVSLLSSAGLIPTIATTSRQAHPTQDAALSVSGLHYKAAGGTDFITMQVLHNATASRGMTFRNICATKISNVAGGS